MPPSTSSEPLFEVNEPAPEGTDASADPPTEEELDEFKAQVNEWMDLDDVIRKLNVALRERRTHQRAFTTKIQAFMIKHKYDNLSTKHGNIISSVRVVKVPIKLAELRTTFMAAANEKPGSDVDVLVRQAFEGGRPTKTVPTLRRVIPKVNLRF